MHSFDTITAEEVAPKVWQVTLNRPTHLNALNETMISELLQLTDLIRQGYPDRYRAVILRGAGSSFCSGGDIQSFQYRLDEPKAVQQEFIAHFHQFAERWYELPLPTIAYLHGHAVGGGAGLALLCDLRFAAPQTKICFSFARNTLIPDMGSHYLLPLLVGRAKALELMYLESPVSAEEALRLGLVNRIIPDQEREQQLLAVAQKLTAGSAEVLQTTKQLVRKQDNQLLAQVMQQEVSYQTERFRSAEFRTAVARFLKS